MTNDIIWDCETYPNVFTLHAIHAHLPIEWSPVHGSVAGLTC